jgi:glycosyltransferase involved in cell wall biosynthesis
MENELTLRKDGPKITESQSRRFGASHAIEASIIVPTFNRATHLKEALASLIALDYSSNAYEILVVDNGSIDNTSEVVKSMIASHSSHQIRYFYEPVPGLLSGRHKGALEAKGEILVFIDDDIEAHPQWLAAIIESFKDPNTHLVGGKNLPKYECSPPPWLEAFWSCHGEQNVCGYLSLLDFGDNLLEIDPSYVWGLNFPIRKTTLFELGGFHPDCVPNYLQRFQGDGEAGLSLKASEQGRKAVYQPKALVYHHVPKERLTIDYFKQRMFYQGVCDSYTSIRREHRGAGSIEDPSFDWKKPLRIIRRLAGGIYRMVSSDPYRDIKKSVEAAYVEGFQFHQNEVRNDPELLNWVLKPDYWDYRLPGISSSDRPVKGQSNAGN